MLARWKKIVGLTLGLSTVLCVAAFSTNYFVSTVVVRVVGPYYTSPVAFDSTAANQVGGHVQFYLAGDSCRIGQIVYISAKNTVKPSATLADYNAIAGVVVGGTRTSMQASISNADTSTLAAIAGQRVIVLVQGRFWVLDSAGGDSPGTRIRPSGTAGRMAAALAAIDSAQRNFGRTVDSTIGGKSGLVQINVK